MVSKRQFVNLSSPDIAKKRKSLENKQTKSKEITAVDQFKAYLEWCGEDDTNFFEFPPEKLRFLCTFWFNVRTSKGELYKVKSLEGIRYSLNRALKDNGSNFDITAKKELKREGKGTATHRPEIIPEGLYGFAIFPPTNLI